MKLNCFTGNFFQKAYLTGSFSALTHRTSNCPTGVTFDYDDGTAKNKGTEPHKNQRGKIEITYLDYFVNKGLSDSLFK